MLKTFSILFTLFIATSSSLAQVKEGERIMSQGSKNSLSIDLPKTPAKFAIRSWKDYVKQYKGKLDSKKDEWFLDNAVMPMIGGANTVDVYSTFVESGESTTVTVWFDLGGAYVNSSEFRDKYDEAEKIVLKYALQVAHDQTAIQLKDAQDDMKKMERNQRGLEKDNKNLHDDIENYKAKIAKAEANVEKNLKDQEDSRVKIEVQKKLLADIQAKMDSLK